MQPGIVTKPSRYSVDETVQKLEAILREKGVKLFAVIDHAEEAAAAGFQMPPTQVVIFGNPKAGTPVMLAAPSAAIDLPLKILVAEDAEGKVTISWNDPEYLRQRHSFPADLVANISAAAALTAALTTSAG